MTRSLACQLDINYVDFIIAGRTVCVSQFEGSTSAQFGGHFLHEKKLLNTGVALLHIDKSYRNFFQYYLIFVEDLFVVS